jgi:hypothetical protein
MQDSLVGKVQPGLLRVSVLLHTTWCVHVGHIGSVQKSGKNHHNGVHTLRGVITRPSDRMKAGMVSAEGFC